VSFWPTAALGDVSDVFNGKTPSKEDQRTEGFPVLKIRDVDELGQFRGQGISFVDQAFANKYAVKWLRPNDILILNAAHNAAYVASKTFFAQHSVSGYLPTGEWLIVRVKSIKALPSFVDFWLRTPDTRASIRFLVKGIHLYPKDVATLQIPLPPLDEQLRIVTLLDRAAAIRRRADAARAKARAIIPALFLDTFGDPATNPKGWATARIGEVVKIAGGGTPSKANPDFWNGTIPWVSPKDMKPPTISDSEDKITTAAMTSSPVKLIPPGNVLIVVRGMILAHTVPIRTNSIAVTLNQDMKALIPNERLNAVFLRWALGSLHSYLLSKVRESAHGTKKLETEVLTSYPILVPPLHLQSAFSEQAQRLETLARHLDAAAAKAEAMAAGLSAEVFS
jgi:type I restriction enzyme, S subunit